MDISENEIDGLLNILISNYRADEKYILTEADATNRFYEILSQNLILQKYDLSIHSELRPFIKQKNGKYKIIKKGKWTNEGRINEGAKFDLSIINNSNYFWDKAFKKVVRAQTNDETRVKYWRFLSYPLEAFKAVFEFKIRVQGNIRDSKKNPRGISKDIEKLNVLHSENEDCLKYLVILDRKISEKNYHKIRNMLSDKPNIKQKIFHKEDSTD